MVGKKTLYIIGAGASSEAKLPTGYELKEKIARLLDIRFKDGFSQSSGDYKITEALRIHVRQTGEDGGNINRYIHAGRRIRDAMPQAISIDDFIDTHNDDKKIELCGKLAIVRSILDAEGKSLLYVDNSNIYNRLNFSSLEKTWYANFMMLLAENCTKDDLSERLKSMGLIVFNYDQCIEHFLWNSLQNYYGLKPDEAGKLVNEIEIYHPYGFIGNLPWQSGQSVAFGAESHPQQLLDLAGQIKTFTEGTDPNSSEILDIRKNVAEAGNIVFLGFAFHPLNMELIMPHSFVARPGKIPSCFGTAQGISDSDCKIIKTDLAHFYKIDMNNINIRNTLNCYHLFKEYWRSLSLN